jgi:diaminopimelate epimerase
MTKYKLNFSKYEGAGNDFIIIDDQLAHFPIDQKEMIKNLCHRQKGIGADGIILVQKSEKADFRFRIFNKDASEAEMCGNGLRCFGKFIENLGFSKPSFFVETMDRVLLVEKKDETIQVEMGVNKDTLLNMTIDIDNKKLHLHATNTGVPHTVIFTNNVADFDVKNYGRIIRYHPYFAPKGTNANFAELNQSNQILLRTYERGVEDETLACGTGATAAAIIASLVHDIKSPIEVITKSQDKLIISFDKEGENFKNIKMSGPARLVFQGEISLGVNDATCIKRNF